MKVIRVAVAARSQMRTEANPAISEKNDDVNAFAYGLIMAGKNKPGWEMLGVSELFQCIAEEVVEFGAAEEYGKIKEDLMKKEAGDIFVYAFFLWHRLSMVSTIRGEMLAESESSATA